MTNEMLYNYINRPQEIEFIYHGKNHVCRGRFDRVYHNGIKISEPNEVKNTLEFIKSLIKSNKIREKVNGINQVKMLHLMK